MPENKTMNHKVEPICYKRKTHNNTDPFSQETDDIHQQLIDELPEGYVEYDLKGNMVCFNKAIIEMGGRDKEELKNLSYREIMEPQTAERVTKVYQEVYRTGVAQKGFVNDIIHKKGYKITLEGFVCLKKVSGKIVGFRGIWRDITERKKTEQELADHKSQIDAIFGSVKDGIIAINLQGCVINANKAVEKICSVSVSDIIDKPFTETIIPCGRSCHSAIKNSLSTGTEIKDQKVECRHDNNPQQVIVLNSSPLTDARGQSMGAVLVIKDVTERLGLEKELKGRYKFQNIIGKSPKMQEIYDLLENLANFETNVLITGESGTGKELVAKALHYAGGRCDNPFVKVNCSALPESLLESELFGHVKGAFTGAIKNRNGRFQTADSGTILLDEIGDISPLIQLKLLRVLQEKEFEKVGESTPRKVDVRIITSTNKDLKRKVKKGEFREDLYYRLKVMEVTIPALRDRLGDVPLLVNHFCNLFRKSYEKNIKGVSNEVMNRFMNYNWPGNVRELEHVLEHCFVLCCGPTIMMKHLPKELKEYYGTGNEGTCRKSGRKVWDAKAVLEALEETGWNKTQAAQLLGVDRRTIHRKINRFHLTKI